MFRTAPIFVSGYQPQRRGFARNGGGGFVPTDIAGLRIWTPVDFYTPATGVLLDQSGNGNDGGQSSSGSRPVAGSGINGHASMDFDGSNDFLDLTTSISLSVFTIGAIIKANLVANWQPIFGKTSGNSFPLLRVNNGTGTTSLEKAGAAGICNGATNVTGAWHLLIATYDGTDGEIFLDGVSDGTGTNAGLSFTSITNIGGLNNFAWWFDGEMAELFIYDSALTGGDLTNITNYEMTKYGL